MLSLHNTLISASGQELLAAIGRWSKANELAKILVATSPAGLVPKANEPNAVSEVAKTIVKLLPKTLTATVLPARAENNKALSITLARIDPAIFVKPSSKRFLHGYRFGVSSQDETQRGPRPDGEITRIFHIVCHARMAILLFPI
jgi:hypothetical protein